MKKELFSLLMMSLPFPLVAEGNDIESISWDRTSRVQISSSVVGGVYGNVLTLASSSFNPVRNATVLMQNSSGSISHQEIIDIPAINIIQVPIPAWVDVVQVIDTGYSDETSKEQDTTNVNNTSND